MMKNTGSEPKNAKASLRRQYTQQWRRDHREESGHRQRQQTSNPQNQARQKNNQGAIAFQG